MKKILLIHTGGTIGSVGDENGAKPDLTGDEVTPGVR